MYGFGHTRRTNDVRTNRLTAKLAALVGPEEGAEGQAQGQAQAQMQLVVLPGSEDKVNRRICIVYTCRIFDRHHPTIFNPHPYNHFHQL